MAVQAHSTRNGSPPSRAIQPPPAPPVPGGGAVEVVGRRVAILDPAVEGAVLPHQLHQIDQVVEIARLGELLVEKEARIALLERGLGEWRERAHIETAVREASEKAAYEREHELIGVIHQQLMAIESAERNTEAALARNDELQARLDDQFAALESSEQTSQAALARMHELQARIDELDDLLRRKSRRWWRRRAA
jgi:chromosome segregation ATPase